MALNSSVEPTNIYGGGEYPRAARRPSQYELKHTLLTF
jgi:hypothetical protein